MLMHAITAAYHNLMPASSFPFALLFLNCDPGEVDVNVHPAKTEVRFRHGSPVHDFVRDTIREILMASRPVSSLPLGSSPTFERTFGASSHPKANGSDAAASHTYQRAADLPFSEFTALVHELAAQPTSVDDIEERAAQEQDAALPELLTARIETRTVPLTRTFPAEQGSPVQTTRANAGTPIRRVPDTHGGLSHLGADWERVDSYAILPDLRALGQLHDSFVIAAGRDGLWIIDQHVAHERILFEQVLRARAAGTLEIQQLLMPLVVQMSPGQHLEYARITDELHAHGFETEPFGQRTIAIKAAPAGVGPGDVEKIVFEILEISETELRSASLEEIRRHVCATIACRAAIKINTKLEPNKIEWLLRELAACEYPMTCPHGRPIALRYSTKDILKSFHRI